MTPFVLALCVIAQAPAVPVAGGSVDVRAQPVVEPLVDPQAVKGLRATFYVAAPPELVLETLWDVDRFRSIFPDIESLQVVAERGDASIDARFFVDAVFKKVSYTLRRDLDRGKRCVTWHSIGGDVKLVKGSWTVEPTADPRVSRVIYTSFVDVGYVVPTGLVRDVAIGKVDEMAKRVRAACARKA